MCSFSYSADGKLSIIRNGPCYVWLLEVLLLLLSQFQVHSGDHLIEALFGIQPDNGGGDSCLLADVRKPQGEYVLSLLKTQAVAICAIETPRFLARDSTRLMISLSDARKSPEKSTLMNPSVSLRKEVPPIGFARSPRAMGDHGIILFVRKRVRILVTQLPTRCTQVASPFLLRDRGDYSNSAY
jgi:hypothetical protein